jgi:ABC-2 type transport system ATP-binding protein
VLIIENATKKYGAATAFEHVSLSIQPGTVHGLIGFNGAGKTTLLKTLCGVYMPEQGVVFLAGQQVFDNPAAKARIFFVPDSPYVPPHASMAYMKDYYKDYYPQWNDTRFDTLTKLLKLDPNKRLSAFSKGMLRQAFLIFALSISADYLLLDELFDGVDPVVREVVRKIMFMAAENKIGIIMTSHNVHDIMSLCTHISVLRDKRILRTIEVGEASDTAMKDLEEMFSDEIKGYDVSKVKFK